MATEEPKSVSLRLSVTDRCQLACLYCKPMPLPPLAPRRDVLRYEETAALVDLLRRRFTVAKVRITGGEPLLRRNLIGFVAELARRGLPDLALTTNGQRLPEMAQDLRRAGLQRINISLDTLNAATYRELTRGGDLAPTLAGIDAAGGAGFRPVKLNTVVLRGVNDQEVVDIARFALARGCEVRFLELMPIGPAGPDHERWFVSSAQVQERLAAAFDLRPLPAAPGASSRDFAAEDVHGRRGVVGFISPCTVPFCSSCRRLRLTATGRLLGCLAQAEGVDVRPILALPQPEAEARLAAVVDEALLLKRGERRFAAQRLMTRVGG
jgi:cyclic pyranopterin phosphate synthase